MQAKDVMTTSVVTVNPETEIREVARLLVERRISAVPVVDPTGRPIGIVSEGDLMRRRECQSERSPSWWLTLFASPEEQARGYLKAHGRSAADVMTPMVVTVTEDEPLAKIAALLERRHIKRVPVVRDERIVGIVSRANLLHGLAAGEATPEVSATDAEIRMVLAAALKEAGIRSDYLDIVVANGTVQLWGAVETPEEKRATRVAAETAPGVRCVEDHVGVMPRMVRASLWAD